MEPHILEEREDETIYISSEGLQKLMSNYRPHHDGEGVSWTADYLTELPIRMKKYGPGSEKPTTLIEEFRNIVQLHGDWPALSKKVSGKWVRQLSYVDHNQLSGVLRRMHNVWKVTY